MRRTVIFGGGIKNITLTQYLLLFSSGCFMFSSINLTLFLLFCVGVKFGMLCQEKKTDRGFLIVGWLGEYLM